MTLPLAGHRQQRCPTGGQDDLGTADDGVTFAVWVEDDFLLPDDFDAPLTFSFCPTSMV